MDVPVVAICSPKNMEERLVINQSDFDPMTMTRWEDHIKLEPVGPVEPTTYVRRGRQ